jgi:hypothetical protein
MDIKEISWLGVDWIDLAEDRHMWAGFYEPGDEILGSVRCVELLV